MVRVCWVQGIASCVRGRCNLYKIAVLAIIHRLTPHARRLKPTLKQMLLG